LPDAGTGAPVVARRRSGITAAEADDLPEIDALGMGRQRSKGREQGLQRNGIGRDQPDRRAHPSTLENDSHYGASSSD